MALTTSDNEHEALSAMKKANGMLRRVKRTWAEVLGSAPQRKKTLSAAQDEFLEWLLRKAQQAQVSEMEARLKDFMGK